MEHPAPRIVLCKLHKLSFVLEGKSYKLANISSSGLGIHIKPGEGKEIILEHEYKVKLQFEKKLAHNLTIIIVRKGEDLLGARIINPSERFLSDVNDYFVRELEIKKMTEVPRELVKQCPEGDTHWFNGGDECDLIYVYKDGAIVRFEIHFYGNLIQGGEKLKPIYALVQTSSNRFRQHEGSQLLTDAKLANEHCINLIKNFIDNLEHLPEDHKQLINRYL